MHLSADRVYAEPKEDDYPHTLSFRDSAADYWLSLSRFSDLEPDDGMVNVLVRDQIHADTADLAVHLARSRCRVLLDEPTAAKLLGVRGYDVSFRVDEKTYRLMAQVLRAIFQGLPGLTLEASRGPA